MEGQLQGERKKRIAEQLGVSSSTLRAYEASAKFALIKKLEAEELARHRCAVLGISRTEMTQEERELFTKAIVYLTHSCGVEVFLVPEEISGMSTGLMGLLQQVRRTFAAHFNIQKMRPRSRDNLYPEAEDDLLYDQKACSLRARRLEEKYAMINASDLLLCWVTEPYRSGVNYARRKHIPVINLAEYSNLPGGEKQSAAP